MEHYERGIRTFLKEWMISLLPVSIGIQKQDVIMSLFIILRNMSERGKYGIN